MVQFITNLLSDASFMIGLVALVGLLAQRKNFAEVLTGTVKTIVGVLIFFAGADMIFGILVTLTPMIQYGLGVEGLVPNDEIFAALALETAGPLVAWVMAGSMMVNILLARITPWKYIFLTGHPVLFESVLLVLFLNAAGLSPIAVIIVGSLTAGFFYTALSALTSVWFREITTDFAIGHTGASGFFLAGLIGKLVGDKTTSTEDIDLPETWSFLQEPTILTSLVVAIFILVVAGVAGPEYLANELGIEQNWVYYGIQQGLLFGGGVLVIIMGVRMMIAEIVPAFQGIAERLVPGSIPALDVPAAYPFAPKAVLIGFVVSTVAGLVTTVIMQLFGAPLVVPPMIQHFFMGSTAAIFGNATGGRRGAVIGAALNGIIFTTLPVLGWQFTRPLIPEAVGFADPDYNWTSIITGGILRLLGLIH
jgi:PTS system ascorbate-specific IIC component